MDYVTIKLHADTRRLLRLIAAQTGEQMVQVMHRLCERECARIGMSMKEITNVATNVADDASTADTPQHKAKT